MFKKSAVPFPIKLGVEKIDEQHCRLYKMANDLYQAMRDERGSAVIDKMLGDLMTYASGHFTTEEQLMIEMEYPKKAEHKEEHEKFVATIQSLFDDLHAGVGCLSVQTFDFLYSWFHDHINKDDAELAEFYLCRTQQPRHS